MLIFYTFTLAILFLPYTRKLNHQELKHDLNMKFQIHLIEDHILYFMFYQFFHFYSKLLN